MWYCLSLTKGLEVGKTRLSRTLQWRHNERDGVSNHHPHDCLLNLLFRRRSKKTSKLRVTGVGSEFPSQRASYVEDVFIWWRHHVFSMFREITCQWRLSDLTAWFLINLFSMNIFCQNFGIYCWHVSVKVQFRGPEPYNSEESYIPEIVLPASLNCHTFRNAFLCQTFFRNHDKPPLKARR